MTRNTSVVIPTLVRIKPGALDRVGVYVQRGQFQNAVILFNKELDRTLIDRLDWSLASNGVAAVDHVPVTSSSFEQAQEIFQSLPQKTDVIIGLGGGKALDVAKYVGFLTRMPYFAIPTALSNDGFCSPQCSLDFKNKKKSFPAAMPYGVVVDTEVCLNAPRILWLAGIGDSVAKITSVYDWKLAYKKLGTQVDDFAALLSDATVFQLMAKPDHDLEGMRLLATALMLNGIAMEISGSSRPASGSEHLISHALDLINAKPRLHGLQVGVSTYMISQLQGRGADRIATLFNTTGFWDEIRKDPFIRQEWIEAIKTAPTIKNNFYTILSEKDQLSDLIAIMDKDPCLQGIFI
ncbi:MAG: iron-containing alcohol dehydrogenase family protein [Candidatus Omnitrophica bacterium]|nr:iron-containing alcohol dehydrogenase family protein [Candidatus Omnitrophota bacterium]